MQLEEWLRNSVEDARGRGLPQLAPLLEALARSTAQLRDATWNHRLVDRLGDEGHARPGSESRG